MSVQLDSGHYMSTVKLGPKGQIVIPKDVRDMFGLEPGSALILMADPEKGIALQKPEMLAEIAEAIFQGKIPKPVKEDTNPEHLNIYANAIKDVIEEDKK